MRGREPRSDSCPRCRWTVSFEGIDASIKVALAVD